MLYDNRNVTFWGNVCLLLVVLLFGVSLAVFGGRSNGVIVSGSDTGAVALTVAVYHPSSHLPALLDILRKTGTPAAFFVSARVAREAPALVRRMREEGHTVGTLGYLPLYDGEAAAVETDVRLAAAALKSFDIDVRYYHSGFRDANASREAAERLGLLHVRGTQDLRTGAGTAGDILKRAEAVTGGSILVVQPTAALNEALEPLLLSLRETYRITTLDSILEEKNDTKTA